MSEVSDNLLNFVNKLRNMKRQFITDGFNSIRHQTYLSGVCQACPLNAYCQENNIEVNNGINYPVLNFAEPLGLSQEEVIQIVHAADQSECEEQELRKLLLEACI